MTSLCPIKYAIRLQLHNTTLFASKVHGTKRTFLRTFWWNFKGIRMTSSCSLMLPPDHNYFFITCGCLKKERNNKNVLKNILHVANFTTWTLLLSKQQRTALVAFKEVPNSCKNKWPPNLYSLHSRVHLFSLQIGSSRMFWRTFCMNKIHFFLILALQATET